jgi:hypothetical protein
MQRFPALAPVMGAARGFAVNGDAFALVGIIAAPAINPGNEAGLKLFSIKGIEDIVQGIVGRHAVGVGVKTARQIKLHAAPVRHLDKVIGTAQHGAKGRQQNLVKGIHHLQGLAGIIQGGKITGETPRTSCNCHRDLQIRFRGR